MYANSDGVAKYFSEAVFRLAADQGNANGQFNLGVMYEDGHGVPKDLAEAARLFGLAADQGNAAAENNLGDMYAKGKGVPKDLQQQPRRDVPQRLRRRKG
jgi:TPR repeat protein